MTAQTPNSPYTVRARDIPTGSRWCYVDENLNVRHDPHGCRPLTLAEARKARRMMIDGAKKYGRAIECEVIRLDRL